MYTRFTLLALAAAVAAAPASQADAEPVSIPFSSRRHESRSEDGLADVEWFLREINNTRIKYHAEPLPDMSLLGLDHLFLKKRSNVHLTDQVEKGKIDELYFGPTHVGGQTFSTDFDTGSSDFFVPGPKCSDCKGTPYDEGGKNEHKTTSVTYGSGSITGNDYLDTVTVGGYSAPNTNVISLTSAKGFSSSESSSLMGLGFSTIASSGKPTFFERLVALKKLPKNVFSVYQGRAKSGTADKSLLTLGGDAPSRYIGKFTSHKVTKKGYWQVAIDGGAVSNMLVPASSGQAAIDTGTTIILAPTAEAQAIMSVFGGVPIPGIGGTTVTLYGIPCGGGGKSLELVFGGKKYAINKLDVDFGKLSQLGLPIKLGPLKGLCLASLAGDEIDPPENLWVVGDSFIKNWYTTFDYDVPSVNFAKSV